MTYLKKINYNDIINYWDDKDQTASYRLYALGLLGNTHSKSLKS